MHSKLRSLAALLPLGIVASAQAETVAALDPVVVTATRQNQRVNEAIAEVTVIDRQEIDNAGPATTLAELLGRSTGIEFARAGGHGADESVFIRGTNSGHALVLVDGVRIGSATTGATAIQMIPLAQIDHIEVLRGPASALYGSDAIGGVIQIFTRGGSDAPRLAVVAGAGTASTYETSLAHSNRVGELSYAIKAGFDGTQGINAIESPGYPGYNPDKDGYRNNNLSLSANYRLGAKAEVGAGFFNTQTVSRYDAYQWDPNIPPYGAAVNANLNYEMRHRASGIHSFITLAPTANWTSTIRVAQGQDRTESPAATVGDPVSLFKTTQNQFSWQNDIVLPLGTLLAGLEQLEQQVDASQDYALKSRRINSAVLGWNASIDAHAVQLNLRNDDNSQFGQHRTWLAGYGYRITPAWRLATSIGTAFKAPTMNDLYFPNTPGVGAGNPNLRPEESRDAEFSLRYRQGADQFRLTYFHNTIRNLIQWTTDPITYYSTPANVGQARIEGVELSAGTAIGNWLLAANATFQDPKNLDSGEQLPRRAKAFGNVSASYVVGPYKAGIEWKMVGTRYDDPNWQTGMNQVHMGAYALTNLFGEYAVSDGWSLFARVDNLFDKNYDIARSQNVIYGTPGISAFAGIRYTLR